MSIWTAAFWKAAVERAVKTFAQAAAALLGGDGLGLLDVDWVTIGSVSGLAALVSVLTSIAGGAASGHGPSLANEYTMPGRIGRDHGA